MAASDTGSESTRDAGLDCGCEHLCLPDAAWHHDAIVGRWIVKNIDQTRYVTNVAPTTRGFTDHEGLTDFGLVHMNGRIYDPVVGRFLTADPFVGDANDGQEYNRYSYVANNPLGGTDPSGHRGMAESPAIA